MTRASKRPRAGASIEDGLLLKFVAGVIGGFGLSIAASALFARFSPGGLTAPSKFHVTMWLVPPLWIAIVSASFLFRSGARAVAAFSLANGVVFALVLFCQRAPF